VKSSVALLCAAGIASLGLLSCRGRGQVQTATADSSQRDSQAIAAPPARVVQQPESGVVFYVPPLPSQGHRREEPVSEWSYLDDTDSILVVVRGAPVDGDLSGSVRLKIEQIPGEGGGAVAADTVARWVQWQSVPKARVNSLPTVYGGSLLAILQPSEIEGSPRLHLGDDSFVTRIRVSVLVNGASRDSAEIRLLHGS